MYIDFKKIRFKNVLSYGNRWTELDFTRGLNLIKAPNGSGKSTILDAINFCLFGKPFRNIKIQQLINKYNAKELIVECTFNINNDSYVITRGVKPTGFSFVKNGQEIDNLSSKKLNQEEIDKLLGINERLFKNIVGIAVTNNKPFLTMSIGDKRSLIESIFNIDVLSDMAKEVKKRNSMDKSEQRVKLSEKEGYDARISDNQKYIEQISQVIANFAETKENKIQNLRNDVVACEDAIARAKKNISLGNAHIEKVVNTAETPNTEKLTEINNKITLDNHDKTRIETTLKKLGNDAVCPLCGSELDAGHAKEHINDLKKQLKTIEKELPKLAKEKDEILELQRSYDGVQQKIAIVKQKMTEEEYRIKTKTEEIASINKKIEDAEAETCNFTTDEYQKNLEDLQKQVDTLVSEIAEIDHRCEIDNKLIEILGDEGLRMYFFKKLLPVLNQRINLYLKKFELQVTLEFDPYMNETIKTGNFVQDYNQFSGGERSRIDMAILLAFFDISKIISNWSCSILFIDEVMDSGVDNAGTEQFLSALHNIVTEDNKNIGIYIISHKLAEVQVSWDKIIEVQKKSMFSELKVGK